LEEEMHRSIIFGFLISLAMVCVSSSAYALDLELTGTISGEYYNIDDIYTLGTCTVAQGSSATLSTWSSVTLNSGFHVVLGGSLTVNVLDTDSDGLLDSWEIQYFGNLTSQNETGDPDNDEFTNLEEYQAQTNPTDPDTDDDGMPDGWEDQYGLDPLDPSDASDDLDNDGYTNYSEYTLDTDPSDSNSKPTTGLYYRYDELGRIIYNIQVP